MEILSEKCLSSYTIFQLLVKYYIYVSDSKIDMLYPQIVNLALKDSQSNQKTRYDKLNVIIKHIEKQYGVGTVDSPKEYFKGVLPMRWGPYGFVPPGESNNFIYFGGKTTSGTILGLGGSIHHLIGEQRGESNPHPHPGTYAIVSR